MPLDYIILATRISYNTISYLNIVSMPNVSLETLNDCSPLLGPLLVGDYYATYMRNTITGRIIIVYAPSARLDLFLAEYSALLPRGSCGGEAS